MGTSGGSMEVSTNHTEDNIQRTCRSQTSSKSVTSFTKILVFIKTDKNP